MNHTAMTPLPIAGMFPTNSSLFSGSLLKILKAVDEISESSLFTFNLPLIKMQNLPLEYIQGN